MWIIKNRVTGEYERKGMTAKRDKVNRSAWGTLGQAKCHVVYGDVFDEWYMDADFIEVTEEGLSGKVEPVSEYIREHFRKKMPYVSKWVQDRLGLLPEPPKEEC